MDPGTAALIAGGLQAAMGTAQGIFGQSTRSSKAARAKKAALKAHRKKKSQLYAGHQRALGQYLDQVQFQEQMWNAKIEQAGADVQFINQHAADTYFARQQQLNSQFQQLAFEDQDRSVRFAKSQGVAAAKAQTGATAGRFDVANAAIKGRNEAIQAREVTGMIDAFDLQSKRDYRVSQHKLSNIGRSMSILPSFGRAPEVPTMPERPSGFDVGQGQMWMDIAGSVVSGAMTALGGQGKQPGNIGSDTTKAFDGKFNNFKLSPAATQQAFKGDMNLFDAGQLSGIDTSAFTTPANTFSTADVGFNYGAFKLK